jgi:hypothetical protein
MNEWRYIEMASLLQRIRLVGFALTLAFALTVLPGLVAPLLSNELAGWIPGTDVVFAEDAHDGGG